jgi:aspartate/methionine/tyrosine aminotransferase
MGGGDGLRLDDGYYSGLAGDMQRKRDRLAGALAEIGFDVLPAHGTYFVTTDFRPLGFNGTTRTSAAISRGGRVTAVPVSAFYDQPEQAPRHFARFCFCKHDTTLDAAIERLGRHFRTLN